MDDEAAALAAVIGERLAPFVEQCVLQRLDEAFGEVSPTQRAAAQAAGAAAAGEVLPLLATLLAADVDEQWTTPLSLVRRAVGHATAVLAAERVPPVPRDPFQDERFPEDPYELAPANLGALGEDAGELAIAWGARKAFEHRRRHAGPPAG